MQLNILSFLQFCLRGSWLTTQGSYIVVTLKFDGASIGAVYSSRGVAAVFMPTLSGIVADKGLSAKWVYALCHVVGAITLFMAVEVTTPGAMFFVILLNSLAYMPTLGLIKTISYYRLQSAGMDIVADFPPIRIWGTIGFILTIWGVSFSGCELSHMQRYIGATLSVLLVLSMIVYGCAFFNILARCLLKKRYARKSAPARRGLGSIVSGKVVEYYTQNGITDWQTVWLIFAGYSLVLASAFVALFKYKHVRVPAGPQPVAY
ncbi:MFS transporter [Salmonella enterica]